MKILNFKNYKKRRATMPKDPGIRELDIPLPQIYEDYSPKTTEIKNTKELDLIIL